MREQDKIEIESMIETSQELISQTDFITKNTEELLKMVQKHLSENT